LGGFDKGKHVEPTAVESDRHHQSAGYMKRQLVATQTPYQTRGGGVGEQQPEGEPLIVKEAESDFDQSGDQQSHRQQADDLSGLFQDRLTPPFPEDDCRQDQYQEQKQFGGKGDVGKNCQKVTDGSHVSISIS